MVIFIGFTAWAVNQFIDVVGHRPPYPGAKPIRLARTHSIFTAPVWGAILSLIISSILLLVVNYNGAAQILRDGNLLYFGVFFGVAIGYSHLALDLITEGGIFIVGLVRRRDIGMKVIANKRYHWAQYRYDNQYVNAFAVINGVILISLSLNLV